MPSEPTPPGWPALRPAALPGIVGEIVGGLLPHTEADEAALLLTLLAAVGNVAGPRPWVDLAGQRHPLLVWPVLVGVTPRCCLPTAWAALAPVLTAAFPGWFAACAATPATLNLSLGDRIHAAPQLPALSPSGHTPQPDPRLFVVDEDGAALAMRARGRPSSRLRLAFAGRSHGLPTQHAAPPPAPARHLSIVGHISLVALLRSLRSPEAATEVASCFLFACVRRSKLLPEAGPPPPALIQRLASELARCCPTSLSQEGVLARDESAAARWREAYPTLTADRPGLFGAVTSRAEVQVMRLAAIYAFLGDRRVISRADLDAAFAISDYAAESLRWIIGWQTGDPVVDTLLTALQRGPLSNEQLLNLFNRRLSGRRIAGTIEQLVQDGIVVLDKIPSGSRGGRPALRWRLGAPPT
jgi:hypothetical protein